MDPENPVPGIGIYTGIVSGYPNVVFRIGEELGGLVLNVLGQSVENPWWFNVETGMFETFSSSSRLSNTVISGLGLTNVTAGVKLEYPVTRANITYKGVPASE